MSESYGLKSALPDARLGVIDEGVCRMKDEIDAWMMIADELGEKDFEAREQLREVVSALGEPRAFALLERVIAIEDAGGERLPDSARRRTPGGVFFRLARKDLPRDSVQRVFFGKGRGGSQSGKQPSAPPPRLIEKPRPRRRIVEVEPVRSVPAAPAESGEFAIASHVQAAREAIDVALKPLSQEQRRQLLEEFQGKLEREVAPVRKRGGRR